MPVTETVGSSHRLVWKETKKCQSRSKMKKRVEIDYKGVTMEQHGDSVLLQQESALEEMDQLLLGFKHKLQPPTTESQPNSIVSKWRTRSSVSSSSDVENTYIKRPGAGGIEGQLYEMKMSFLVFLRCVSSGSFYLASNLKDSGAFDDIVLKYKDELTEKTRTYFIQLKHKSGNKKTIPRSELLSLNGDFSLVKYFISYRDEICVQYESKENPIIFSGNVEESELILYTNAIILQPRHSKGEISEGILDGSQTEGFLHSNANGISYVFTEERDSDVFNLPQVIKQCQTLLTQLDAELENISESQMAETIKDRLSSFKEYPKLLGRLKHNPARVEVKKLLKDISEIGNMAKYPEFIGKLKIYHQQSSQNKLDDIIKAEIKRHFDTSNEGTQMVFDELMRHFEDWWKDSDFYLSEKTKFWIDIVTSHKQEPSNLSRPKVIAIKQLKFKFQADVIDRLKNLISDVRVLHIVPNGESTILTCCKVYQTLCSEPKDSFIFMNWNSALTQKNVVLSTWHTRWANVLLLEGEIENEEDSSIMFQEITKILCDHPHKKIILITRDHISPTTFGQIPVDIFRDHVGLLELNTKTQEQIMKKCVRFQSNIVPLGELVGLDQELKENVTEDILIKLAQGERISIGEDLPGPINNYIARMLERKDHISSDIQAMETMSTRFAVSGTKLEDLQPLFESKQKVCTINNLSKECQFIVLEDSLAEKEFSILCKESPQCHWLHKDGNSFKVREAKGTIEALRQNLDDGKRSFYKPKTVWNLPGRTVVVTAEPGMGKSTLIKYIAKQSKLSRPSTWIVHINLNSHTELMETLNSSTLNEEQVFKFLLTIMRVPQGTLGEKFFKTSMFKTGKMVIFFDGFDEICPYYEDLCTKMIEVLLLTRVEKIWITSRATCINKLEMVTSSLSFGLTPFSEEEQKKFIKKVWLKHCSDVSDCDLVGDVIKVLLERVSVSLSDTGNNFAAIPLHTMIISEVYEQHVKESLTMGCVQLPQQLDILKLYDGFFEKKFQIYFREKKGDDLTKPAVRRDSELCWKKTDDNHKAVALVELLSQEDQEALHDKKIPERAKACLQGVLSGTEMIGIIVSIVDGKPQFVHRTFLEYFSAKWFAENYHLNQKLIKNKFLTSDYSVVRGMFDHILAKGCPLHEAVMNAEVKKVKRLVNIHSVNTLDSGGRTPLHLSAITFSSNNKTAEKCKQIGELLVRHGADISITDAVFQWTPLRYADATRAWILVGLILENNGCTDDLILTKMNLKNMKYIIPALYTVAENGFIEFLHFLIKAGIKSDMSLDNNKSQMIHLAAQHGQEKIVEYLLKAGAELHARDRRGWTPLHYAARVGQLAMVKYLISGQHKVQLSNKNKCRNAVNLVLCKNQLQMIERASDVNIQDGYGWTALHHAACKGQLEVVKYLCKEQAANVDTKDRDQWTPLHYAASQGHIEVVQYLVLTAKANSDHKDRTGRTAIFSSVTRGWLEVTKFLAEKGVDTKLQDQEGWTLLHFAAMDYRLDIVKYLIENLGVNPHIRDNQGQTPLDLACGQNIRNYLIRVMTH